MPSNSNHVWVKQKKISCPNDHEILLKGFVSREVLSQLVEALSQEKVNTERISLIIGQIRDTFALIIKLSGSFFVCTDHVASTNIFLATDSLGLTLPKIRILNNQENTIDSWSIRQVLMSGFVGSHGTVFNNVRKVPAGCWALIRQGNVECVIPHFSYLPNDISSVSPGPDSNKSFESELTDTVLEIFERIRQMYDGEQIVVPLSGGFDSRLVASALHRVGCKNVVCFSYGKSHSWEKEASRAVASKLGFKWINVSYDKPFISKFFSGTTYEHYVEERFEPSGVLHFQELPALWSITQKRLISQHSIFMNGSTGDFLAGGHIPVELFSSAGNEFPNFFRFFLNKHYSLWGDLRDSETDRRIIDMLESDLEFHFRGVRSEVNAAHCLELLEWYGRQSNLIMTMQYVYEFFGYNWHLPLWDKRLVDFFADLPLDHKRHKNFYKEVLVKNNWGGVWQGIPVNNNKVNPISLRLSRYLIKSLSHACCPSCWQAIDRRFFEFYLDEVYNPSCRSYWDIVWNGRGVRNRLSWVALDYVRSLGVESS